MAIGITNTITYTMNANGVLTAPSSIDPIHQGSSGTVRVVIDSADYGTSSFDMQIKFRREKGTKPETKNMVLSGTDFYYDLVGTETLYAGTLKISFNVYDAGGINLIVASGEEDLAILDSGIRVINEGTGDDYTGLDTATAETNVDNINNQISVDVLDSPKLGGELASEYVKANDVDVLKLNQQDPDPTYEDGQFFYSKEKNGLVFRDIHTDTELEIGKETIADIVWRGTGTLANGTVATLDGSETIDGSFYINAVKADARYKNLRSPIAVITHDIAEDSVGIATKSGLVRGLDTSDWSGYTSNKVYLGEDGLMTKVRPVDGHFITTIGEVVVIHATDGVIEVNPTYSELTVDVTNQNGFPPDERFKTSMNITELAHTFNLVKISDYHFYQNGEKFEKTSDQSVVFTDVDGLHAVYFDDDVLTTMANPDGEDFENFVLNKCLVSIFNWNFAEQRAEFILDERHGLMPPTTHLWAHQSIGTVYLDGMAITIPNIDVANPTDDTALEFSLTSGRNKDEDITHAITEKGTTDDIREYAFVGTGTPVFTRTAENQYGLSTTGTGRLAYNLLSGSTYSVAEPDDNKYVWRHIYAIPEVDKTRTNYISIMGFGFYDDANDADEGISTELGIIRGLIPAPEYTHAYSKLYKTKSSFANTYKSASVSTADGSIATDYREASVVGGGALSSTSHSILSDRSLPDQHPDTAITNTSTKAELATATTSKEAVEALTVQEVTGNVDANDYVDSGRYSIRGTITNRPTDASVVTGFITVIRGQRLSDVEYIQQTYGEPFNDDAWIRWGQIDLASPVWGAWQEMTNDPNKLNIDFGGYDEKVTPHDDDLIAINDSEDSGAVKYVKKSALGGGAGGFGTVVAEGTVTNPTAGGVFIANTLIDDGIYKLYITNSSSIANFIRIAFKEGATLRDEGYKQRTDGLSDTFTTGITLVADGLDSTAGAQDEITISKKFGTNHRMYADFISTSDTNVIIQFIIAYDATALDICTQNANTGSFDYQLVRLGKAV